MSREIIKAFFEKIESDKDLQAKMKKVSGENKREAVAQVVEIASAAGFKFADDELANVYEVQVEFCPGFEGSHQATTDGCCHYAQSCMPGFQGH